MTIKELTNWLGVATQLLLGAGMLHIVVASIINNHRHRCVYRVGNCKETVLFFFYMALASFTQGASRAISLVTQRTAPDILVIAARVFFILATIILISVIVKSYLGEHYGYTRTD